ncbi:MAG: potassium-transporting ATPase subunit KdpA [Chloroflexi bacterium]|nr:potassium-transporting ATPase subunit KdpA [Chloroflexota bacterium]
MGDIAMIWPSIGQYTLFLAIVIVLVQPVGAYLARVFTGQRTVLDPALCPIERALYRLLRIDPTHAMAWPEYATAFVVFSLVGTLLLYAILRLQVGLPGHDATLLTTPLTPDLAMNTAISFATTTTWQAYGGETTMSYLSQMVGLAAQNFLAGAAGLAVGVAFIRGFVHQETPTIGNFWVDLVRALLWVLLPVSLVGSLALVWQGTPLTLLPAVVTAPIDGSRQTIAWGPVAALEFIKNLGTNGGGYFNVNGAHPFANPTPLANLIQALAIVVVPAAFTHTFGRMTGRVRDGWLLFWVMTVLFVIGLVVCDVAERQGNPAVVRATPAILGTIAGQPADNLEGKETRFGVGGSVLAAVATSNGATGSYVSMHGSYTPLGGMTLLVNMLLGEMVYGGLGAGLYSILMVALVGVFIAGLMIGRTPEYLGKRVGPPEMKLIMLYALMLPVAVLTLTAVAVVSGPGLAGLTTNDGPHGFTEILYAFTSSVANNGQSFAGLTANSPFYNITTTLAMMVGRFGLGISALALAGHLAAQPRRPPTSGTLPTDTALFGGVLAGTAIIVGALSAFPALALGPIVEHLAR